jgi:protein CMS1
MMASEVISTAPDELDDGLEYEVDLVSDNEANPVFDGEIEGLEGDDNVDLEDKTSKKRSKNSSFREKKRMKMELDMKKKKDLSLEESTEIISDYLNNKIRKNYPDLSALELTEKYFTKSEIRSTFDFEDPRTLDNLSKFIENKFKNMLPTKKMLSKKGTENGEEKKFIAIISMSAIRACDTHRATKELGGGSIKLINKNKLDADLKIVGSTHSRILCCTPSRLIKVLDHPDLRLTKDQIKIIIVDNSYLDTKQQNIWDVDHSAQLLKELTKSGSKLYLY